MISVPQEGESYEVSGKVSERVHEEFAKRSGGSLNAYLGNVLEYDKSRKIVQGCAIKAAAQANSMCKSKHNFPESLWELQNQSSGQANDGTRPYLQDLTCVQPFCLS